MRYSMLLYWIVITVTSAFSEWKLVWSDEFDSTGLPDPAKWGYDVGTGSNGWGNQELEYYTEDSLKNAHVENGMLTITAVKENIKQSNYTSARLVTSGRGDWLYGRFEIAAKVPKGVGLWPAIWMLPTDWEYGGWPKSGELDIMENVGFDSMRVHFNIHTEAYNHSIGTNKGATVTLDDPHTVFNVYAMEWYEDSVMFFLNDKKTFTFKNEHTGYTTWPYNKKFHLLLNVAVGGSWGGSQGVDTGAFPASMVVDYVRVYEWGSSGVATRNTGSKKGLPQLRVKGNRVHISSGRAGTISVYASNGAKVFRADLHALQTSVAFPAAMVPGVYYVQITTDDGISIQPLALMQ